MCNTRCNLHFLSCHFPFSFTSSFSILFVFFFRGTFLAFFGTWNRGTHHVSSYLCMSFLSEGFFELRLHCLWSRSGWGWGGVELVLSLTSKLIMLTQSVPVISFFSQPFFKRAATPTRRNSCPHTHIHTACIKNSCHTRRYKDAHGSGGKAAAVDKWGVWDVLRGGGKGDAPLAVRERPTGRLPSYSN